MLRTIVRTQGVRGLYSGGVLAAAGVTPYMAINMTLYEHAHDLMVSHNQRGYENGAAGGTHTPTCNNMLQARMQPCIRPSADRP